MSIPVRALDTSTCWRVANSAGGVTWYETQERALRAFARAAERGDAVYLIDPHNTVTTLEAICPRCLDLGYPASECHVRNNAWKGVHNG